MKSILNLKSITLALCLLGFAMPPLAAQGPVNHEITKIKINEPVLIPGKVLPPGEYEIRVMDHSSERDIVQFRNLTTNKVEAMVIALNNYRTRRTGTTKLEYWETPKGTPPALRAWFYPDERWGVEFVYPTAMAKRIEQTRQTGPVPQADYGSNAPLTQETAKQVDLSGIPRKQPPTQTKSGSAHTSENTTLAKASTTDGDAANQSTQNAAQPQAKPPQSPSRTGSSQTTAAAQTQPQSSPQAQSKAPGSKAATASQQPAQASNTLLAQNTTKSKTSPATTPTQQNSSTSSKNSGAQMPQTASPVPAIFLTGLGLLTGAFLLRRRRRMV